MTETMTRWTITLPYATPPLTANECKRMHWAEQGRRAKGLREATFWLARSLRIPPLPSVHVVLHYRQPDKRRRDADNLMPTRKHCIDGLVDAGIVPDDTPQYVSGALPVLHEPDKTLGPALWLEITGGSNA